MYLYYKIKLVLEKNIHRPWKNDNKKILRSITELKISVFSQCLSGIVWNNTLECKNSGPYLTYFTIFLYIGWIFNFQCEL